MQLIKKRVKDFDAGEQYPLVQLLATMFRNQVVSPPALAIKTASSALAKTTSAVFALVEGVLVKIAANTDMPALTPAGTVANGSKVIVMFVTDASGTLSCLAGNAATQISQLQFPQPPDGTLPIGYLIIENATGSNFVGGTTALDTASLTVTYVNQYDGFYAVSIL